MANVLHVYKTAERPDIQLWLRDIHGALVDFSTGYTFVFKLGQPGVAATFTKSTGITGAAGSGTETSGTPNVTLSFAAADLDGLTVGTTTWQLKATTGGLDRFWQGQAAVHNVIL